MVGRHTLALVVRDASLALRDHAGGEVEDHRLAALQRDAGGERVGAEARVGAAVRRDDAARDHVDEVQRHQASGHRLLGPGADAAQVVRVAQCHHAAAVPAGALDAQRHRLAADHLAEAGLAIEPQQRAGVELGAHVGIGLQAALEERIGITRQHADAVRVVAGEVGLDQVVDRRPGLRPRRCRSRAPAGASRGAARRRRSCGFRSWMVAVVAGLSAMPRPFPVGVSPLVQGCGVGHSRLEGRIPRPDGPRTSGRGGI